MSETEPLTRLSALEAAVSQASTEELLRNRPWLEGIPGMKENVERVLQRGQRG